MRRLQAVIRSALTMTAVVLGYTCVVADTARAQVPTVNIRETCEAAAKVSVSLSSPGTGGDLGFIPQSTLDRTNPELRKMVLSIPPGQVSGIIKTAEGYRILKVIAKEPAGQRELNDPRVQQTIRETLLNRRDQLLKAAYYEVARNDAKVTNYVAASLMPPQEKKK